MKKIEMVGAIIVIFIGILFGVYIIAKTNEAVDKYYCWNIPLGDMYSDPRCEKFIGHYSD